MINYIPFLKSKSNEIIALAELDADILEKVIPFFDYPKRKNCEIEESFKSSSEKLIKSLKKHLGTSKTFYYDTYDLKDSHTIDGKHVYRYILELLKDFPVIPVVSIDRSTLHQKSVSALKINGTIKSSVVAFRVTPEDFQNFKAVENEITEDLQFVFNEFEKIDLIFDCRVCSNFDAQTIANEIINFSTGFTAKYSTRKIIVTGSSIPASIAEILAPNNESYVQRKETDIFKKTCKSGPNIKFTFGDYTTVSPNYSDADIPPEQMQNRTTAKLSYSFGDQHYFIRGGSLKTRGAKQYFDLAAVLCAKTFFRGSPYSLGDKYFYQKSQSLGNNCYPNTIVKPSVNAHITYSVRNPIKP
ncbi:T4 beta protein [Marinobacter sp. LV10R520-4]|uniref:beta family protein n=1 Tax=Marinobacter sp. LV10R520-4 TaxID=1761796 RepID=UPI000BF65443|nr:beta family protein [Marinobacter sp. LV10R520-4]PFG53355.1 T4 beta protein [Marinobacter sp. LV10R520-4]